MKQIIKSTERVQGSSKSILLLFVLSLIFSSFLAQNVSKSMDRHKVCMVDDEFKGEQQLTTTIKGEIFFGCCQPCIDLLNTDSTFRYAIDPYSKVKITKANAYIANKIEGEDAVFYFESENNYQHYLKNSKK